MSRQSQRLCTTFIPYFLLAFACKSTRALFLPDVDEDSKADSELQSHGSFPPHVKRQFGFSSSSSFLPTPISPSPSFFPDGSSTFDPFSITSFSTTNSATATQRTSSLLSSSSVTDLGIDGSSSRFTITPLGATHSSSSEFAIPTTESITKTAVTDLDSFTSSVSSSTAAPTLDRVTSKNPAIPIIIGTVIGCLIAISLVLCLIFLRKRRRNRLKEDERVKVEKAFGGEAGFHLLIDTGSDPTGVHPYTAPPTSQPVVYADDKTRVPEDFLVVPTKAATVTQSSAGTSSGSILSSPVSPITDYASPTSALSQQSLLEQLNFLRAQIQHVEALAGISTSGSSSHSSSAQDSSEPPPDYNDANHGDTRTQHTGEKGAGLP